MKTGICIIGQKNVGPKWQFFFLTNENSRVELPFSVFPIHLNKFYNEFQNNFVGMCLSKSCHRSNVCHEETWKETNQKTKRRRNGFKWKTIVRKNWLSFHCEFCWKSFLPTSRFFDITIYNIDLTLSLWR